MTVVVITGGRDYNERGRVFQALDLIHVGPIGPITKVVWGGADGADLAGGDWADLRGVPNERVLPDWSDLMTPPVRLKYRRGGEPYNALAGFARNQKMIDDHRPDHALVCPGGNGTADMFDRILKAGIQYTILEPSARVISQYTIRNEGFWYKPPRNRK